MAKRINDMREHVTSIDQAKDLFADIAADTVDLAAKNARAEKRISEIKRKHDLDTAEQRVRLEQNERRLRDFITTNRHLFKKPRKVKTSHGTFGLQKVNDVVVSDEHACLNALAAGARIECIKHTEKPIKTGILALFKQGIEIPGCSYRTGDTAVYKVSKSLIDMHIASALGEE